MGDISGQQSQFLLYHANDGATRVEVRFNSDTAWLSLNQMAELFQRDKSVISRHIKNVFDEGELTESATVAKSATVQTEGDRAVSRGVEYYNLDVIISVGYRVKSPRGTQFRIWATQRLREYIIKGFPLDHRRRARSLTTAAKTLADCFPVPQTRGPRRGSAGPQGIPQETPRRDGRPGAWRQGRSNLPFMRPYVEAST